MVHLFNVGIYTIGWMMNAPLRLHTLIYQSQLVVSYPNQVDSDITRTCSDQIRLDRYQEAINYKYANSHPYVILT